MIFAFFSSVRAIILILFIFSASSAEEVKGNGGAPAATTIELNGCIAGLNSI